MPNEITLIERIEAAVRTRNIPEARKGIRLYLKNGDDSATQRSQVAEWYRRLGLYREGYLHVTPKDWKLPNAGSHADLTESFLWTAYFLDLQGASDYAFKLLQRLSPNSPSGFSIAGTIQMSNFAFADAVKSFQSYFKHYRGKETYAVKMIRISLADSFAGMQRFSEARSEIQKVSVENGERFLAGIIEQALGEYAAGEKKYDEAYAHFEKATSLFPSGESTVDSGFLAKWKGVALAGLGKTQDAQTQFNQALSILDKPDHRPEILLDVYRCMYQAGLLDEAHANILGAYPGLSTGFKTKLGILKPHAWIGMQSASIQIYPDRDEWAENGKSRLGIPLEIALLAHIRCADRIGVSLERLKTLLWPDEISAFVQMDSRIAKLIARLRTEYEIALNVENGRARASGAVLTQVSVELQKHPRPWTFAEKNPKFDATAFAEHYGLGRTIAFKYLSDALSAGWLKKTTDGRRVLYGVDL